MQNSEHKNYRIALDAMGGDFAPINEVQGAILACEKLKENVELEVVLVGNENKIRSALSQFDSSALNYSIVNAEEIVTMDDDPTTALKKKRNSSLYKGLEFHSQGYADAFVSAGNTGAVMSTATVMHGRISGVSRPTIGQFFPSIRKIPVFVLDVGANIDCKPRHLYEFAVMGSIHVSQVYGLENPKVGLMNIGEEPSKGTEVIIETHKLMRNSNLNFIGNVEGGDIFSGSADVIVCDGFEGNIILKFAESIPGFLKNKFKKFAGKSFLNKILMASAKPAIKNVFKDFDYEEYGGVPLLGINGVVIIGHGKSSPKAIQNMIYKALEFVRKDINGKIEKALNIPSISEQIQ
jgi:glycerol-3-phosphate acyltransferase PlsX